MDLAELLSVIISRGVDHVLAELPQLVRDRKVDKEDLALILNYALLERLRSIEKEASALRSEVKNVHEDIKAMHKDLAEKIENMNRDLRERLDLINNQLRVLNANIASTYELTSKVVAVLMAKGTPVPP